MMLFKKMESSEGFLEMDMDREQKSGFRKGGPCGRWMGLPVLLGMVAMVISMVMLFVICGDLVKKVVEVQNSVSSLNLYLNKSSDPMPNVPEKRLSNIETLVNSFSSSWSSVTSKQDGNLQRLEQHQDTSNTEIKNLLLGLSSSVSALTSKLNDAVSKQEQKLTETERLLDSLKTSVANQQNIQCDFGVPEKKLTNIETLVNSCSSSLSSVASRQDANLQRLEQQQSASITEIKNLLLNLSSASALTSKLNDAVNKQGQKLTETEYTLSNSLRGIQSSVSNLTASVMSLSSEQQTTVRSAPTCRSGWTPYSSSCYLFSTNTLNWTEARDYCKEQGASLLKLDGSEAEWAFVTHLTIPNNYWIGLTDQTTGLWRWTDGTPYIMNKEHWSVGQPDDWKSHGLGEEGEDCGHIKWSGELNDSHCSIKYRYACKVQF